jgi:hypothetical protein
MTSVALRQFTLLEEAWESLPHPRFSRSHRIGPHTVALSSPHPVLLRRMSEALEHLTIAHELAPDLSIRVWETKSGQGKLPPLDWNWIHAHGYSGRSDPPFYFHYFSEIGALSALNIEAKRAYYVVRSASELPWWVSGSPLQQIFHPWLRERGMQLTHSASVGNARGALLLAGKGGSGKSTTTLSCLSGGLLSCGEDYCVVEPGLPRVYSVYQSAKLAPPTRARFPACEPWIVNPESADQEKALVYYRDLFPGQIVPSSPLLGIVSLTIGREPRPQISLGEPRRSIGRLLSTTIQLPFPHRATLRIWEALAQQVKHYEIVLGRDEKENVRAIAALLEEVPT